MIVSAADKCHIALAYGIEQRTFFKTQLCKASTNVGWLGINDVLHCVILSQWRGSLNFMFFYHK